MKANPDSAQLPVRQRALEDGKTVYMAVPRLAEPEPFFALDPDHLDQPPRKAASISGASRSARRVTLDELAPVDLVVMGCVAAGEDGARLGKGGGFADLEFALATAAGLIGPHTVTVTTVHEIQLRPGRRDPADQPRHRARLHRHPRARHRLPFPARAAAGGRHPLGRPDRGEDRGDPAAGRAAPRTLTFRLGTGSLPAATRGYARLATWPASFVPGDKVGMGVLRPASWVLGRCETRGRCLSRRMAGVAERFVIPDDLARAAGREGRGNWLAELPALVARIAAEWRIEVGAPFLPGGMTAWVAPARDDAGQDLVLKVGWPHPEAAHEADGLRTWDGAGAIRVCQVSELAEATVLLLERCRPGTQLRASPAEEHDLVIAGLLRRLWVKPPPGHGFRPLSDMSDYWANRYEQRSPAERSCLEAPLAKEGIRLLRELPRTGGEALLLHTDLHAGNVLAAEREPWLAIDPKPYVGEPAYDVTQHIFNGVFLEGADAGALAARMARLLDLDLNRILLWLFARAVEASPYWAGMPDLARTLYSSLT